MNIPKRLFTTTTRCLRQKRISASYYRGGTSRALIFNEKDLPSDKDAWKPIFLGAMGSPDPHGRQLNGMGGGISSLSKICVVSRSKGGHDNDAQVDFTFVQVGVKNTGLDFAGNCGNMTSAIGPYAIDSGIVDIPPSETEVKTTTTVKLYNTNTQKHIHATFPVSNGEADLSGPFTIDGVSGSGAKIQLDFIDPAGSKTGSLLPTGNKTDVVNGVRVSCVDAGNPCVFVRASDLGMDQKQQQLSHILPEDLQSQPELLEKLELIRRAATIKMGMARSDAEVPPSIPKICIVETPSGTYRDLSGAVCEDGDGVDVTVRAISTQQPHKALPITAGLALSAAARLEGTVVHECVKETREEIGIGHPSGKLVVGAKYEEGSGRLERVTVYRTARRLMEGVVYWD